MQFVVPAYSLAKKETCCCRFVLFFVNKIVGVFHDITALLVVSIM